MRVPCDVSDRTSVEEAWSRSLSELDAVPILINNAGFDRPGFFLQSDPRDWKDLLDVNLTGVLNCIFVAGPHISQQAREQGYGRIVNIASDAGRVGSLGRPFTPPRRAA